jgi:hypothetical protein
VKEGEGGRSAINLARAATLGLHSTPTSFFTISCSSMLTPLTKRIRSKENSLHLFPKFYLFLFFDFMRCNDAINMLWKRSK